MLMGSSFFLTTLAAAAIGFLTVFRKFIIHQEKEDSGCSSPSCSSPPSSLSCKWTHHVFPSFRGEDVRRNFLSHIQKEFKRKGITPFVDNEIRRGESIGPELIRAIRGSKIAIVLLSRNYASSKWCLDELVEIMKCKKDLGQTVFAIFYEVDPSHVKKLTGEFGAVFEKTCKGKTKEDIWRWRQALKEVTTIAGYDSRNWDNEAVMIEDIVNEISTILINSTPSNDFGDLIGLGAHMEKMKWLLCLGSDERRTIGISGPSGIGKTTIARVVYNQISDGFQLSVFMKFKPSYTRPTCSDDHDVKLQLEQQLLSQLMNQEDIKIHHLGTAQNLLMDKRVLIVLDGVDQSIQLRAMPKARCLGPGSRIIITTQDQKLLKAFEIKHIYKVDFPPPDEALQIFCLYAFGQNTPYDGFEKLAREVYELAGRLPLGLRVMGSHLQGMSKQEWEEELPKLRIRLDGEIESILKLSYDALDEEEKYLFLHIACFFNNECITEIVEDTLRHKFSSVTQGLRVLAQRSLISDTTYLPMHNLLVLLGREIVRNQSIYEPGKRQFLVDAREICKVLTDDTGSKSVIGIDLDYSKVIDELNISERAFEEMSNLEFLKFHGYGPYGNNWKKVHLPKGLNYLSSELRILHWVGYPMTFLPSKFNPSFLVKIYMPDSKLEKLWEGVQPLVNLKFMDLRYSKNLKEVPDLSTATNLLELDLNRGESLVELPSSIGNATNLKYLDLSLCSSLVELPSSIGNLINLRRLYLVCCSNLVELPSSIGNLINLERLDLSECSNLVELPSSIGNLTNLHKLYLSECSNLVELPSSIGNAINLQELNISGCSNLVELPSSIGNLINLQILILEGCSNLVELPSSIGNLINLERLDLSECSNLVELPSSIGNLISLEKLILSECSNLVELPSSIGNLTNLHKLYLSECSNLVELPSSIGNAINLHELNITGCSSLVELPSSIGNAINLRELDFTGCSSLVELPLFIGNLINLKKLDLREFSNLVELPSSIGNLISLEKLDLTGFSNLVELPSSIGNLTSLEKLDLHHCTSLLKLPSSIGNLTSLERLYLSECANLVELPCSIGNCSSLEYLNLNHCSNLVVLPSSIGNIIDLCELYLSGCSSLVEVPSSIGNLRLLRKLSLQGCSSLVEVPSSIGNLRMLKKLRLQGCSKLEALPVNINLDSLKELDITGCSKLISFPVSFTNIERLLLCGTLIREVPLSIKSWSRLHELHIPYSKNLEGFPHALDIIRSLELNDTEIEDVPPWVSGISCLDRLVLNNCTKLVSLPQLPSCLSSLYAENCESLERLTCSFPNPVVCLKFINCWKLNENARDIIIQTSTSEYVIVPGREVPSFFTYRAATGGSLTVKLNQRLNPTSLKFKACILLVNKGDTGAGDEKEVELSSTIMDKQSGYNTSWSCLDLQPLLTEHQYIFEVQIDNVISSELLFEFLLESDNWEIVECGIRELSEDPHVDNFIMA